MYYLKWDLGKTIAIYFQNLQILQFKNRLNQYINMVPGDIKILELFAEHPHIFRQFGKQIVRNWKLLNFRSRDKSLRNTLQKIVINS